MTHAANSNRVKPSVLVVEDEALLRMDLVCTLQQAGLDTFEAGDAAEAVALLEAEGCDVVFTDLSMPGRMNGLALAHYVRKRWPPTLVVIISADVRPQPEQLPKNVRFIAKPYDAAVLDEIVAEVRAAHGG